MIRVSSSGDIFTLPLRGDVDHMEMVDIRNSISDLIGEGHAKLIVSMKEVEHINYLSIGVLTSVGAEEFFECFDSEEEAVTSFSTNYDWEVSAQAGI
jgi:hypothetical protein